MRKGALYTQLLAVAMALFAAAAPARNVAITMDDLDLNANDTPRLSLDQRNAAILDALSRARIKAAIFVCGMRVDSLVGRQHVLSWGTAGHTVANHSYSHTYFPGTTVEKFSADVLRAEQMIRDVPGFEKWFRFPMLKEGRTPEQRDGMRAFLKANGYRNGYVTIDTSEWAIDARLRKRLRADPNADLTRYRQFYLEHIWDRAQYYDDMAQKVLGRSPDHTLLIHHNLLAALFLPDLLKMFRDRGWTPIDASDAFKDPVFDAQPNILPAGESIIWALAKESGRFESVLRYPAEDGKYEDARMDALGL
jgi:peptidoglycan/xylan/chitin deacetylase (PgdA/CDA1 family)